MMMGLLMKDIIGLKGFSRMLLLLVALYIGVGIYAGDLSTASATMIVLCAMLPMSSVALDDQSKWNAYACCLPVRRGQAVAGKYLLVVTLVAVAWLIMGLSGLVLQFFAPVDWPGLLLTCGMMGCVVLLMNGLTMPLLFQFGVEKARLVIMIVFMAAFIIFTQVDAAQQVVQRLGSLSIGLMVLAVIAVYVASYLISVRIYEKKEF